MYNMSELEKGDNMTASRNEQLASLEVAIQGTIFSLALIGNSVVLFVLYRYSKKITRIRFCILHLAIADILVALFNILPQMIWDITYRFQGNDVLCRCVKFGQVFVMYLSTYILVVTAIDRYVAICHPFSKIRTSKRGVKWMIMTAWSLSVLFSIPQTVIFRYQALESGGDIYDCWATFQPSWTMPAYITCFTLLVYIIPLLVLIFTYGRIACTVWGKCCGSKTKYSHAGPPSQVSHMFTADTSGAPSVQSSRVTLKQQTFTYDRHSYGHDHGVSIPQQAVKTIRLTFVVVIAYVICWSPFFVTQLWWSFDNSAPTDSGIFVIMLLLASLNSCCNPWIYLLFSGNSFKSAISCFKRPHSVTNKKPKASKVKVKEPRKRSVYFRAVNRDVWGQKCALDRIQFGCRLCPHVREAVLRHSPGRQFSANGCPSRCVTISQLRREQTRDLWNNISPLRRTTNSQTQNTFESAPYRQTVSDVIVHKQNSASGNSPDLHTV